MIVEFASAGQGHRVDGDHAVYDNALLFVAGDYPSHDFAITAEEMAAAVADFKPVKGNLDHTDWLAGEACEVRKAWIDPNDKTKLRAQIALPLWLNSALKETQKKLSAEWNKLTKTLAGVALCTNPGIKDAALVAAFSQSEVESGRADPKELAKLRAMVPALNGGGQADFKLEDKQAKLKATLARVSASTEFREKIETLFSRR